MKTFKEFSNQYWHLVPDILYHGTNEIGYKKISEDGFIKPLENILNKKSQASEIGYIYLTPDLSKAKNFGKYVFKIPKAKLNLNHLQKSTYEVGGDTEEKTTNKGFQISGVTEFEYLEKIPISGINIV